MITLTEKIVGSNRSSHKIGRFRGRDTNGKLLVNAKSEDQRSRECKVSSDRKNVFRKETIFYSRKCDDHQFMYVRSCFKKNHTLRDYKSFFFVFYYY